MSSLLLSRLSRLCLKKPPALGVRRKYLCGSRFLSAAPIYRIIRADSGHGSMGRLVFRNVNASEEEEDEVLEKMVPTDLMEFTVGASHGWIVTMEDLFVRLRDNLNPGASYSDPKKISLLRPKPLPHCQTELVTNVAMSSSPEDEDCILAVKFLGPQLSFCRPTRNGINTEWVNIRIEDPCFFSSRVTYSERYKMFSMLASGGTYIGYWDIEKRDRGHNLEFAARSHRYQQNQELLLVEAPTGETFLVKWYTYFWSCNPRLRGFMVFKIHEYKGYFTAESTYNIGDVSIFFSTKGQPFCLEASLYGLTSNCIYYVSDLDFGKFNISDNVMVGRYGVSPAPYFIPPQSS